MLPRVKPLETFRVTETIFPVKRRMPFCSFKRSVIGSCLREREIAMLRPIDHACYILAASIVPIGGKTTMREAIRRQCLCLDAIYRVNTNTSQGTKIYRGLSHLFLGLVHIQNGEYLQDKKLVNSVFPCKEIDLPHPDQIHWRVRLESLGHHLDSGLCGKS